jgi:LysR family transcriptional regulator, glycine cleavage system transcriptional activator
MATASLLQLKHLDLLRGLVAVGRRMSITVAAEDVCIAQSAVSRRVRALENIVGLP